MNFFAIITKSVARAVSDTRPPKTTSAKVWNVGVDIFEQVNR
jgi:hypothetical protein